MAIAIRQIALVARELDPVVDDLCAVFGIEVCYNDPGVGEFGLHNALMTVGNQLLEVVAPVKEDTTAGRYLDRRSGDGGYMVIFQTDDLEGDRKRVDDLGVRVVWDSKHDDIASFHMHPRDVGGAIVSIDQPVPPESWRWGGPDWDKHVRTEIIDSIVGATLQSDNPPAMALRWSEILALPEVPSNNERRTIPLEGGRIDFVEAADGRGNGISAFTLKANDRARAIENAKARSLSCTESSVLIGGVLFTLTDA